MVPDGEKVILGSILDCFSDISNIKLFILSSDSASPFRFSKSVHRFFFTPSSNDPIDWIEQINRLTKQFEIDVIMPIWETAIETILAHHHRLENPEKLVPLPSLHYFRIARGKHLLADHLRQFDIPGPKSLGFGPELLEKRENLKLNFPLLLKPIKGGSGHGISKFEDFGSLQQFAKTNRLDGPYILQEYIQGEDYGCNVLCQHGEILAFTMQKGKLWDPKKPYSYQIGLDFVYNEDMFRIVKSLMKSLQWNGIADIDLLYHEDTNTFFIVEINPRFWATLTGALMAGVNYPSLLIQLATKRRIATQQYNRVPFFTLRGLKLILSKDLSFIFKADFIWNNTPIRYRLKDPMPVLYRNFQRILGRFKK